MPAFEMRTLEYHVGSRAAGLCRSGRERGGTLLFCLSAFIFTQEPALCTFAKFKRKRQHYPRTSRAYLHTEVLRVWTSTNTAGIGGTDIILHSVKVFQITLCHVIQSYFDQYNTKGILKLFLHFCLII